jgi:hypothetical protein
VLETNEAGAEAVKALTVSQPFASLLASGDKWVENRTWGTSYRGELAIHAGKGSQYLSREELKQYPTGCVLAVGVLVACVNLLDVVVDPKELEAASVDVTEFIAHEHTEGPWCWVFRLMTPLEKPVPAVGKQGLWEWERRDAAK